MTTKIDLDEIERKAKAAPSRHDWPKSGQEILDMMGIYSVDGDYIAANSPQVTLALIARIRELEYELREWIEIYEEDPADYTETRKLLEKGVVLK